MLQRRIALVLVCLWAFLVLGVALALADGPVSSQLTANEMAQVKSGQIVVKNKIEKGADQGYGVAYGIIKGTPEDFWKVIFDHEHYMDFYPRLKGVTIVERTKSKAVISFKMDATIKTLDYTTIGTVTDDRLRMDWVQDETRPHKFFKKNDGYWQLEQLEPGVLLVEYKVLVALDLGPFSGVASKIVNMMAKDDLPDVVDCTRKRVESGGTWVRPKK
jgi:ribosome-associated toxin RatA of RatAB toxin-antitoxin module